MSSENTEKTILSGHDVEAELLADWRFILGGLHARFETGDFETGVRLVRAIGEAADEMNHHPDVDLTYPRVDVRLTSHDAQGVTSRDIVLARTISELAGSLGATPKPNEVAVLEVGIDTPDHEQVKDFWAALLGYEQFDESGDDLRDPDGTMPSVWFQKTDHHDEPRQGLHFDLWLPPEVVETRIRAALDAGGTMVSEERAPTFWVLADAQGNRACICTWLGRSN